MISSWDQDMRNEKLDALIIPGGEKVIKYAPSGKLLECHLHQSPAIKQVFALTRLC